MQPVASTSSGFIPRTLYKQLRASPASARSKSYATSASSSSPSSSSSQYPIPTPTSESSGTHTTASDSEPITSTSNTSVPKPTHHLITLKRSAIGLPPSSRLTLEALGLHRLHQKVLHPFGGPVAGKILRVKELVSVHNVTEDMGKRLLGRWKREGSGVVLEGRVFGGGRNLGGRDEERI